jgi:hypothetical protein
MPEYTAPTTEVVDAETPADKVIEPQSSIDTQPETPQAPTLQELLDKADAKELRKHSRIAGMIGSERQQAINYFKQHDSKRAATETRDKEEKAFLDLVEGNTDYIKEHHPLVFQRYTSLQQERAGRDIDEIRGKTVHQLAQSIGRALNDVPEWSELSTDDHETIAKELIGKPDDDILPIFNRMAITLVADRRAAKLLEKWKSSELPKEREAIKKELAAQMLKTDEAPDLARSKGQPKPTTNINDMTPAERDKWWENHKKSLQKN